MQFEMTDSICALCKIEFAPSADALPGPSRLCRRCRQLVQTILPKHVAARTTTVVETVAAIETPFVEEANDSPAIMDDFDYREEIGATEPSFFRPEEESYYKTDLEIQPEADEFHDFVEDFPGAPHDSVAIGGPVDDVDDLLDQGSINIPPRDSLYYEDAASGNGAGHASEAIQNVTQVYGAQPSPEYFPATTAPLEGDAAHELAQEPVETFTYAAEMPAPQATITDEAITDPWEEPLPSWDYSRNEYPVLLSNRKPNGRKKLWLPIAAGLLIVLLVAAYFVLSQPDSSRTESPDAQNALTEPVGDSDSSAAQALPAPIAAEQQSAPAQASTDTAQPQTPVQPQIPVQAQTPPAAPTEFGSVGTLTLQSAAFPDELGASEFSQKLIRAGIPAYVVPADLARKGRWFRVRVGRFTNADDAKKYAVQSRQRAKAAGMNVDFIVVEYGKP